MVNIKLENWDNAINYNLRSAMLCCKYAIPHMIETGRGSIINVSTVGAIQGFNRGDTGFAAYSASKAGLIGLTLSIAADYAFAAGCRTEQASSGSASAVTKEETQASRAQTVV